MLFKGGPLILKFIKSVKFIKIALAGGSMLAYSYLFTWEFALILLASIIFHEFGHITAMKKCGMKTKGIFLIPFFGGAAVPDDDFKSRTDEAFVALYGPFYGLLLLIPFLIYGVIFNEPLAIGIVSFMALINLFNLFPINPLDGGRLIKSITFSLNNTLGLITVFGGLLFAIGIVYFLHIWILLFIIFIGTIELFFEWKLIPHSNYSFSDCISHIRANDLSSNILNDTLDHLTDYSDNDKKLLSTEFHTYVNEFESLSESEQLNSPIRNIILPYFHTLSQAYLNYNERKMLPNDIKIYSVAYVLLFVIFTSIIFYTGQFDGADLALRFLKDDM
jgi:Zn-dependent protease